MLDPSLRRGYAAIAVFGLLCWSAAGGAEPPAPAGAPPIAFVALGAGDLARAPAGNPVTSYVAWAAELGPRLERCGVTRVMLHNPGGSWPQPATGGGDPREMRVDQWLLAERARLPFADREALGVAVAILRHYGVREVIVYVGSPTQLVDPLRELPAALAAFTACGPTVSFGFDALFEDGFAVGGGRRRWQELWAAGSDYREALARLRLAHKVYAEARLHPEQLAAGLGALVDGTIADARFDRHHAYDLARQPGETIRLTDPRTEGAWKAAPWWPETKGWAAVTPLYRSDLNWGPLVDAYPVPAEFVERNKR